MNGAAYCGEWLPHFYKEWHGRGKGPCVYTKDDECDVLGCATGRYAVQYSPLDLDPIVGEPRLTARAFVLIPLIVRNGFGALLLESECGAGEPIAQRLRGDIMEQARFCGVDIDSLDFSALK